MCTKKVDDPIGKAPTWKRAGLKNEAEYCEYLARLGYEEAVLDDYVPGKGFCAATLLHIGNGIWTMVQPVGTDQSKSSEIPT